MAEFIIHSSMGGDVILEHAPNMQYKDKKANSDIRGRYKGLYEAADKIKQEQDKRNAVSELKGLRKEAGDIVELYCKKLINLVRERGSFDYYKAIIEKHDQGELGVSVGNKSGGGYYRVSN